MTATFDERCSAVLLTDPMREAIDFQGCGFSWGEVRKVADELRALLASSGVPPGAPIAFVPRNRPSAIAAELALVASRCTISMVYAFQSAAGIARDIDRLNAGAVIAAAEDFTAELLEVVRRKGLAAIALSEMQASAIEGAIWRGTATFDGDPKPPEIRIHTSGTTGAPKHIGMSYDMIDKYIVGQNIAQFTKSEGVEPAPALLYYPLGNISGIYTTLPPLLEGRRVELLDRFNLPAWVAYVKRYRPTAAGVPAGVIRMILDADISKEDLSSLKVMPTGAAPLDPAIQRAFEEQYGIPILLSYGATEFGGPVTLMTPDDYALFGGTKLGSVGRPYAGAKLRVIDPDSGAVLEADSVGILEVMAPRIGVHWIRTTDLGMIDADGFIYLRGRADGAIIRGGFKLLPETIENALCLHPAVAASVVVGIPDERLGQVPAAVLQLKRGKSPPAIAELEQFLRQHVYATHIPAEWKFVEALPRNPTMKVDIVGVKALFAPATAPIG